MKWRYDIRKKILFLLMLLALPLLASSQESVAPISGNMWKEILINDSYTPTQLLNMATEYAKKGTTQYNAGDRSNGLRNSLIGLSISKYVQRAAYNEKLNDALERLQGALENAGVDNRQKARQTYRIEMTPFAKAIFCYFMNPYELTASGSGILFDTERDSYTAIFGPEDSKIAKDAFLVKAGAFFVWEVMGEWIKSRKEAIKDRTDDEAHQCGTDRRSVGIVVPLNPVQRRKEWLERASRQRNIAGFDLAFVKSNESLLLVDAFRFIRKKHRVAVESDFE